MEYTRVADLKGNMDNVNIRVRVIEAGDSKVIETKNGPRTISEALVGDESGRIKLTLWGKVAGSIRPGDAIEIRGGWTTVFRGQVQLNVGQRGSINRIDDSEVPTVDEIPEGSPRKEAGGERRGFQGRPRYGGFGGQRRR
ncbi:MAG: single-stranded DNA-binding protein [Acidilobaceae archaeon]|nr:single-stranded DNA-binding protein [Acidilobaceae archaeon]MCX8165616.1 single-stranded DNA-binding protein [Acidilobaceae archaeon]MDW7974043.1 single-stranded DNA-binding protein [Sulfolobales archaeon]